MQEFAYFQEQDSEQFAFYKIPKVLFTDPRFNGISTEAKIMYGVMLELADEGYVYVVSMDLASYFDTVNHSKLIEVLSRTIKDGRVISLIHKYLNAGVMADLKERRKECRREAHFHHYSEMSC